MESWRISADPGAGPWDDAYELELQREPSPSPVLLVWFVGDESTQRQNLTRLAGEWPYALEVIEPIEPGDLWGARIARCSSLLERDPTAEFEISDRFVSRVPGVDGFLRAVAQVFNGELVAPSS